MKLTKLQIVGMTLASIVIIMAVVFTAVVYRLITTHYDYGKPYDDKLIRTFGKKEMAYYTGGMRSATDEYSFNKFPEDSTSSIDFDVQLKPDGTMVLYNIAVNGSGDFVGIHLSTSLEASTYTQDGNALQHKYDDVINNAITNNVREGSEYGLDRYVRYMKKSGSRTAHFREFLITMKDETTPLRILETVSPPSVRKDGGGGVNHYFMYNDLVQVEMFYQKYYLKDWQFIENSMIAYLDQLYKDGKMRTETKNETH